MSTKSLQDGVRQKSRGIADDPILVLADRQPARRVVDQPAAEYRKLVGKIRQRGERLRIKPSAPYGPSCSTTVTPSLIGATLAPSRTRCRLEKKLTPEKATPLQPPAGGFRWS